jgi:hypothetical protein
MQLLTTGKRAPKPRWDSARFSGDLVKELEIVHHHPKNGGRDSHLQHDETFLCASHTLTYCSVEPRLLHAIAHVVASVLFAMSPSADDANLIPSGVRRFFVACYGFASIVVFIKA